jgi:hypothetical protein
VAIKVIATPDGGFDVSDERGRIVQTFPHPNVSLTVLTGHGSDALVAESFRFGTEYLARHTGPAFMFSDSVGMESYDGGNVKIASRWFKANRDRISLYANLVKGAFTATALRLMGTLSGMPMKAFTNPIEFKALLDATLREQQIRR